jgi:hypothetical protein
MRVPAAFDSDEPASCGYGIKNNHASYGSPQGTNHWNGAPRTLRFLCAFCDIFCIAKNGRNRKEHKEELMI